MRAEPQPGVLLLGNYPPPFGGVPSHIRDLAAHLASRGWQVHVIVGSTQHFGIEQPARGVTVYRFDRWDKLRALATLPGPANGLRGFYPRLSTYLAHLSVCKLALAIIRRHNIQAISAYHIFGSGTLGAWLSRETGVPLITTIFGEIYADTAEHRRRRDEVDFVARHTRRWLSCSRHCARSAALLNVDWQVEPLVYGIDVTHFRPDVDGSAVRQRFGWQPEDQVVTFVGRMSAEMGLDILLQALPMIVAKRPNTRFLIAGARHQLTPNVAQLARDLRDNVAYQIDVPYEELPQFYAASSIVAAPSVSARACLGLSIAEGMASAKPVVACRVGGTLEVLQEEVTGVVVPPNDPLTLATAVLELLDQPARCRAMGLAGRARALTGFDKRVANEKFETILQEIAGGATPGARAGSPLTAGRQAAH
jgi:glycosyltransferase involved in cell wall biosynthesis